MKGRRKKHRKTEKEHQQEKIALRYRNSKMAIYIAILIIIVGSTSLNAALQGETFQDSVGRFVFVFFVWICVGTFLFLAFTGKLKGKSKKQGQRKSKQKRKPK